jgi:hypothetical protein
MAFLQQHGIDCDAGDHPLMRGAVRSGAAQAARSAGVFWKHEREAAGTKKK